MINKFLEGKQDYYTCRCQNAGARCGQNLPSGAVLSKLGSEVRQLEQELSDLRGRALCDAVRDSVQPQSEEDFRDVLKSSYGVNWRHMVSPYLATGSGFAARTFLMESQDNCTLHGLGSRVQGFQ